VYQNQESLEELYKQIKTVCQNDTHEILFINDASTDKSGAIIDTLAKKDSSVVAHHFMQNVGQHRAALKGIELSQGSAIIIMDADLQDPPQMIPTLLSKLQEGYDAVFAGKHGKYESPTRLFTSKIFKYLLHRLCNLPKDAGMYVALNRPMIKALSRISMPTPFLVAMIGLTELKTCSIPFSRQKRPSGKTTYTGAMRLKVALKALYQVLTIKRKTF